MHDIKNFTKTPLQQIKKLAVGDIIELLTFKKDRKILIVKSDFNFYKVIEDGFEYKEFENIDSKNLEKLLKQLKRIEFPRSNKFHLNVIKNPEAPKQITF